MAYELETREETPKKTLKLRTFKLKANRIDYLAVIILSLLLLDALMVLIAHRVDEGISSLVVGLTLYLILKREEQEPKQHQKSADGKVSSKAI